MTNRNNQPEPTVDGPSPENRLCVQIPVRIGTAIEQRLPATNFDSTDEYVSFVLESLLRELDQQDGELNDEVPESDDSGESAELQDRLESLGYL